jgi:hypothetical protein
MSARIESKAQKPVGAQEGPVAILLRLKDAGQVYVLSKAATLRRNSGFRWDSVPGCVLSGLFWRIDRKYEQNFRTITLPDQPSLCSGPGCATVHGHSAQFSEAQDRSWRARLPGPRPGARIVPRPRPGRDLDRRRSVAQDRGAGPGGWRLPFVTTGRVPLRYFGIWGTPLVMRALCSNTQPWPSPFLRSVFLQVGASSIPPIIAKILRPGWG